MQAILGYEKRYTSILAKALIQNVPYQVRNCTVAYEYIFFCPFSSIFITSEGERVCCKKEDPLELVCNAGVSLT